MTSKISPTLNHLISESAKRFQELPAIGFALERPMTYGEFHEKIAAIAAFLEENGLKKHDRVAILAENSPYWGIAYFATVLLGAIGVPILPDFTEFDVKHIIHDAEAKIIFTTGKQLEKLYDLQGKTTRNIITLDDAEDPNSLIPTTRFSKILRDGTHLSGKKPIGLNRASADDIASIIYTSGTSGHSKAVMLTHKNFCSNLQAVSSIFAGMDITQWRFLSILPISHAYEFTICFLTPLANGSRIIYAGRTPTPSILEKICREEHPHIMCMVPMIIEKIYKKKILPALTMRPSIKFASAIPFLRKKIYRQIGSKLMAFFGGNLHILAIGGAALNLETEKFLREAGIPYLVGYGLTEAAPVVSAGPFGDQTISIGSCGKPLDGVEVSIVNPDPLTKIGEIFVAGDSVMLGYHNNPEATAEAMPREGLLATGDLGYLDKFNNLFIKGRSKSVIVLSHGENIYPESIEDKINASRYVIESLVSSNDERLEARVFLDYELIDEETRGKSEQQKLDHIKEQLATLKKDVNNQLPSYSQLTIISERTAPFTKTATQKIKRYLYRE